MPTTVASNHRKMAGTIFGRINAKNVYFLIDISGSMYSALKDVKEHMITAITEKATKEYDGMFNIVAFSDEVYSWASSLMPCTPRTVSIAAEWVRNLESKTSTNTKDALLFAFQDPGTDAVFLVTDGLPNDKPSFIISKVKEVSRGRPVNCFYISGSREDIPAVDFLRNLAEQTGGNLSLLTLDTFGSIKGIRTLSLLGSKISSNGLRKVTFEEEDGLSNLLYKQKEDYERKNKHTSKRVNVLESSNLAAALMTGKRVLARRDADGFYYLASVIDVVSSDVFRVKFDDCPALSARYLEQETPLENIISYEDALRNDISVGEKALVPFRDDGKYGPATVVGGYDLRNADHKEYGNQCISVSTYNGQCFEVPCGVSVKISEEMNNRIRDEIYLPESSRKHMTNGWAGSIANSKEDVANNGFSRLHHSKADRSLLRQDDSDSDLTDLFASKIERQIEEGEILLRKLYLEDENYARELGYAASMDSCDSLIDEHHRARADIDRESFRNWREKVLADTFRSSPKPTKNAWIPAEQPVESGTVEKGPVKPALKDHAKTEGYHKHRLELLNHWEKHKDAPKYSPFITQHTPLPPKKVEKATHSTSTFARARPPKRITFRTTTIKSGYQPRIRTRQLSEPRASSNEYHAFDGIPFPPSTDRKFKPAESADSWTVDKTGNAPAQPINIITNRPIEYYKNGQNNRRSDDLQGTRNAAWEKRQHDLANERAKKETIYKERQEYHRMKAEEREKVIRERIIKFREGEELNRNQSRAVREDFVRYQKGKEERAQRYKQERIDAMRERRMNKSIEDTNRERSSNEAKEKLQEGHSLRNEHRRKAFESSLDSEIVMQEKKLERLRKMHASMLNKEDTRTARAFKSRDLNDHVKDQSRQIFRASIIP